MRRSVRHLLRLPVFWATLLTVLYVVGISTRIYPPIFGPEGWRWPGRLPSPATFPRWWPSLLLLALYLLVVVGWIERGVASRPTRGRTWAAAILSSSIG